MEWMSDFSIMKQSTVKQEVSKFVMNDKTYGTAEYGLKI